MKASLATSLTFHAWDNATLAPQILLQPSVKARPKGVHLAKALGKPEYSLDSCLNSFSLLACSCTDFTHVFRQRQWTHSCNISQSFRLWLIRSHNKRDILVEVALDEVHPVLALLSVAPVFHLDQNLELTAPPEPSRGLPLWIPWFFYLDSQGSLWRGTPYSSNWINLALLTVQGRVLPTTSRTRTCRGRLLYGVRVLSKGKK